MTTTELARIKFECTTVAFAVPKRRSGGVSADYYVTGELS